MNKFNYDNYLKLYNIYSKKVNIVSIIRLIVFMLMVFSFFISSSYKTFFYSGIFLFIVFIILIFIHDSLYKKLDYYKKYLSILDEYKDRIDGSWKNFIDNGKEFNTDLFNDLNIVGDNSLFQYISICKTIGARKKLIKRLSNNKYNRKMLEDSYNTVKELRDNIIFDIDFQVKIYDFRGKNINLSDGFKCFDNKESNRNIDLVIGMLFSFICLLLLVLGYFKIISINYFYGMFIFNFLINYMYSYIYINEFNNITNVSSLYGGLKDVYNSILSNSFKSSNMIKIFNNISNSYDVIKKIGFIDNLNNLKNNILSSFIFNGLFSVNIITMYLYSNYQINEVDKLKSGINSIEDLEMFISLASVGIVNDDVCIPNINDNVSISFKDMKHPLISNCIGNDFNCKAGVNIITGSNMGGKTTFIRSVGINIVLMNAGTFVCASEFNSSYFNIFSSIIVNDDISRGISTFYGELLRIKEAIKYNSGNRLVLIDEIFKGTNYNDRIYGAKSVINKLNDNKTIVFVTTHDFELCDVKNINNYYFREYYEGNSINFDYKIREGKCVSTNAKYLMKNIGIID